MGLSLIPHEKILKKTSPHILAMIHVYAAWLYLGLVGFLVILWKQEFLSFLQKNPFGIQAVGILFWTCWSLFILIPATILSFMRIHWYWLLLGFLLVFSGMFLHKERSNLVQMVHEYWESSPQFQSYIKEINENWFDLYSIRKKLNKDEISNYWLIGIGMIGVVCANSYRRSHRYYITNRRVIIRFGFMITRERDLLYSKIEDLILHRDILGKLFNFGTLIPISASGIGTGSDQAILMVGAQQKLPVGPSLEVTIGGGHSVTVPRAPSFYSLYGIPDPESLRTIMLQEMEQREYLRKKEDESILA